MTDLDNTRSMPTRPDLDKLRAGVGAHQAAAYIEYLESLPCQAAPTLTDLRFVRQMLRKYASDPRTTERVVLVAREVLRRIDPGRRRTHPVKHT